jgi:Mn2+/Fe2+ NRAMP family transporter
MDKTNKSKVFLWRMIILCSLVFIGDIVYVFAFQEGKGTLLQFALAVSSVILGINAWLVLRIVERREILKGEKNQ